jgi:AcrR family transcriptional regulator
VTVDSAARPVAVAATESVPQDEDHCPPGLRERKKAATRQALGLAAMRLAVQRGLDNVLIEDIAAEAGVSARTFSNYFASKHEAICALAMDRGARIGAALRARPPGEPLGDAIMNAILEQFAAAEQAPDRVWIDGVRLAVSSPALQGEHLRTQYATQRALAEAIADRTGADPVTDMFPAVMAGAAASAMHVAMDRWLHADPPTALAPLVRQALSQLCCEPAGHRHAVGELGCDGEPDRRSWPGPHFAESQPHRP